MKNKTLLLCIWVVVVVSFVTKHLTNDFFVFWGYARQVTGNASTGLNALIDSWEIKGMLFRLFAYGQYLLSSMFTGDIFTLQAQTVYKLVGLIFLLLLFAIAVFMLPEKYCKRQERQTYILIGTIFLFSVHFASHFQPEMLGVVTLFMATSFYLRRSLSFRVLSGVLIGLLFFLKSPMIIMGGSLFFATLLLSSTSFKRGLWEVVPTVVSAVLTIAIALLFLYLYNPQEIKDIWDASYYQQTLLHDISPNKIKYALIAFTTSFLSSMLYNPVILVGFVCMMMSMTKDLRGKHYATIAIHLCIWLFPAVYITISNCFFVYHYYLMVFPAVISIIIGGRCLMESKLRKRLAYVMLSLLGVFYLYFLSAYSPYNIRASKEYQDYIVAVQNDVDEYVSKYGSGKMLYLDGSAFLFPNPSYLRYTYPLPIQRIEDGTPFTKTDTYQTTLAKILAYNGNLISLAPDWFYRYPHDEIKDMIENNYIVEGKIDGMSFTWDLFGEKAVKGASVIYRKK